MRSEKLFRPFIRPMFNSHCGGIRLDEVSLMKRIGALLLCGILLLPAAGASGTPWPAWAAEALAWGREKSVSRAFLASPGQRLTRGAVARLLYESAGQPAAHEECPFSDVSEKDAVAVGWAAGQGYLTGVGDGTYEPGRPVTRQEFAAILWRQAGTPEVPVQGLERFGDAGTVSEWARDAVLWCQQAGVMAGRSGDKLAPEDTITTAEALVMLERAAGLPDVGQLRDDLEILAAHHRPVGSLGEADAVRYLRDRFEEMWYSVTLQPYTDGQGRTGHNVAAVKAASVPDADILVLSAHHDSVPTAYGANDNASGVAALLYTAEALRNVPTDTEVRFLSFTDEENGKNGSRTYTASLTEEERTRIVGAIQFDMLGGLGSTGTLVCTVDGEANWVSDLLQKKNPGLESGVETASDHTSFQLSGIPAVLLMQRGRGYLYHSAADTAEQLDLYAIAAAADSAAAAAEEICSADTPSYRALAREQGERGAYRQTRQNMIYFGSSRADTEAYIGAAGEPVGASEISGEGWTDTYETYHYSMHWFDSKVPMSTYYQYRNGFLERIELRPEETGYTGEQVRELIEAMYGSPVSEEGGQTGWSDPIYSKYITLSRDQEGCLVTVGNYSVGITNVLASYPVSGGQAVISDPEDAAVWNYLCSILPLEARQKLAEFNLFTDGTSNVLAYTSPIREEGVTDNTRFSISIDYFDVYDENGEKRDWSKLTYTILHEYGHVLLEDETQVDLTVGSDTHDPAGFVEGAFRISFYDAFWRELGVSGAGDYDRSPTHYVSRYGANYFHEDIADTFAVFVLGGEPGKNTVAEEKLRFFWRDPDMTALRSAVRENLGLEWPKRADTSSSSPAPPVAATLEELEQKLMEAIVAVEQPPALACAAPVGSAELPMAVKNLYYSILSDHPEYKYAYDLTSEVGEDGLLRCKVSYMPYRTGAYPAGFQGIEVDGLDRLVEVARGGLSQESIPIRITEPTLTVDAMNRALQQVGGGWLLCQLSRDGTAITVTPQGGLSREEALNRLAQSECLARQVYEEIITAEMGKAAQAEALYAYLTEQVRYDFRYYSQPGEMPYSATTAYGALHDHLAICGGYAQAFQMLLQQAEIPCITVSGKMGGENHMWVLAQVDGQWLYFDPTSDRGRVDYGFQYFGVGEDALLRYTWDREGARSLTEALFP